MQDEHFEHFKKIQETAWRRALKPEETANLQKFLSEHPQSHQAWAEESALNRLLQRMPAPPVSTNFTARVLAAAQAAPMRRDWREWFALDQWLPESRPWRLALYSMMLGVSLMSYHEYQSVHREQMARQLAGVSSLAALPPMDWLHNFDTINGINKVRVADDDLLAALQ